MIAECLEHESEFGVLLIREGSEVGGPATPFEIGTLAKIVEAQRFSDGRYNLKTIGSTPFQLLRITQATPYMRGEIKKLDYDTEKPGALDSVMETVRKQFAAHLKVLSAIYGSNPTPLELPKDDPELLSYTVANVLAVRMLEKQTLLEVPNTSERLKREAQMLARENKALQAFLYLKQQRKSTPEGHGNLSDRISPN